MSKNKIIQFIFLYMFTVWMSGLSAADKLLLTYTIDVPKEKTQMLVSLQDELSLKIELNVNKNRKASCYYTIDWASWQEKARSPHALFKATQTKCDVVGDYVVEDSGLLKNITFKLGLTARKSVFIVSFLGINATNTLDVKATKLDQKALKKAVSRFHQKLSKTKKK